LRIVTLKVKYQPVRIYILFICVCNVACYTTFPIFFKHVDLVITENTPPDGTAAPRLLDVLRESFRVRHYGVVGWNRHNMWRNPPVT